MSATYSTQAVRRRTVTRTAQRHKLKQLLETIDVVIGL